MTDELKPLGQGKAPEGDQGLHDELIDNSRNSDAVADRAWMDKARRRYQAIRSGTARTLDHDEVVARLEARFGADRAAMDRAGPLSDAWKAEIDRRTAEYEVGRVELIDNE